MAKLEQVYGYFEYIKKGGNILSGIAIFGMILFITLDVLSRNLLSSSIPGSYEMVRNYLMPLAAFPIILYAYSSGIMPRISMIIEKAPKIFQKTIHILLLLLELIIVVLITYYSFDYGLTGTEKNASFPAAGYLFPVYPFLFLVPIGFGCIAIEIILLLLKNFFSKGVWITFQKQQGKIDGEDSSYVS
ncbi:TRAP transporter small permease [Alkalihalobacillus sp. BA299]|uniref:TRAP transporter small permease n=1 Tax=Alkalihalobacillus sp. BA299 TaxID=2815938 RepID=UPI001AD96830|nr:TRAP transporter small permease subunit [Alkalihalobacillus sp. BA299]